MPETGSFPLVSSGKLCGDHAKWLDQADDVTSVTVISRSEASETLLICDSCTLTADRAPRAWAKFPNLKRLVDEISARPAAQRAVALKDKYKLKAEMDDEARKAMFRHLAEKVA